VEAHTLGEMGILGTVLLRAYSGTMLPSFIEIGSYLTQKEPKISWHSFFETRCISDANVRGAKGRPPPKKNSHSVEDD